MTFKEWIVNKDVSEFYAYCHLDSLLEEYQKTIDQNAKAIELCKTFLKEKPSDLDIDEIIDFIDELPNCHFRGYLSNELSRLGDYSDDTSDYIDKIETILEYNFR